MSDTMVRPLAKGRGFELQDQRQALVKQGWAAAEAVALRHMTLRDAVAPKFRDPMYLRYLLLGLIGQGDVPSVEAFLRLEHGMGRRNFRLWLNEVDHYGGEGLTHSPAEMYVTFMLCNLLSGRPIAIKVKIAYLLLKRGFKAVNAFYDPPVPDTKPGLWRGTYNEKSISAFAALCDPAWVEGISVPSHKLLLKAFLRAGGKPFARMMQASGGASAYERAYVYYPYLMHVFPGIPTLKDGTTNERYVDYGEPLRVKPGHLVSAWHRSPFKFRPR